MGDNGSTRREEARSGGILAIQNAMINPKVWAGPKAWIWLIEKA
jgi:hypothetical protein